MTKRKLSARLNMTNCRKRGTYKGNYIPVTALVEKLTGTQIV